jgi:plasmid stabilization system protein ParE
VSRHRVDFAAAARRHVTTIAAWWGKNRPKAPMLFWQELDAAVEQLAGDPQSGSVYREVSRTDIHRLVLPKTRYHVYYSIDEAARIVLIRAVWHTSRGRGPRL